MFTLNFKNDIDIFFYKLNYEIVLAFDHKFKLNWNSYNLNSEITNKVHEEVNSPHQPQHGRLPSQPGASTSDGRRGIL